MGKSDIMFLDFDDVVNISMWRKGKKRPGYNYPEHGKVNNFQAVQWVSELCEERALKIVISSTWRKFGYELSKSCLIKGGLRKGIEVIGTTPIIDDHTRPYEIKVWLNENREIVSDFIVVDDIDMSLAFGDRMILCKQFVGFTGLEFFRALNYFEKRDMKGGDNGWEQLLTSIQTPDIGK
jgi:hypothetical protein